MKLLPRDIDWRVPLPEVPEELPVVTLATPSYEERLHAVHTLHERFALGDTVELDLPDGVALASRRGEVQYFAASGAVRARDADVSAAFPDERRAWTDITEVDGEYVLGEDISIALLRDTGELLRAARLLADGLGDVDVVLDRWARVDESGAELERGPGRAVVRALYLLDGVPFLGAGAKTRLAFEPVDGRPVLARLFHVHRPVIDVLAVRTGGTERALTGLLCDPSLVEGHKNGATIVVSRIQVGLLTLPAVVPQRIAAPAIAVSGTVENGGTEPFARYYQAISATALRGLGLAAAHLPH